MSGWPGETSLYASDALHSGGFFVLNRRKRRILDIIAIFGW